MKSSNRSPKKGRFGKNHFVTKSGKIIKLNRGIAEKFKARKDAKMRRKAVALSTLPKGKLKRFFARLHPKRLAKYWFSREGGIMALKVLGISTVVGFIFLVGLFAYFRKDLPNLRDISGDNLGGSIRYFDRTGEVLLFEDFDAVKRVPVESDEISKHMENATIAIEDQEFFQHGGFDTRGIIRAGWNNFMGGQNTQGGSTITQQLVKLTQNWTDEQTYTRKIKELILSVELERTYSKQEILTGYLNTAPYGNVQYGVEAATRDYFEKSAKELTIDEAAFLAAIPQSPSFYSPYGPYFDAEAVAGRQHYIIDLMYQQDMITAEERDKAQKVDTVANTSTPKQKFEGIRAPWFVLAAKNQLEDTYGSQTVKRGGWSVRTTLDMELQELAEEQVQQGLGQIRNQGGDVAGFTAQDITNGQMVALVGGADFTDETHGQINYSRTPLPPGSSFKPYDYIALMEENDNVGAGSVLYDTQGPLEGYPCTNRARPPDGNCLQNFDFRYPGPMTIRYALGGSRNVPAVKAGLITGVDKTIETAEKMGLRSGYKCYADEALTQEEQCYASSTIGDGAYLRLDEHVHAYGTISRHGKNIPQTYILEVTDSQNNTIDEWELEEGDQVIRPDSAYIIADILSDPNASYTRGQELHRSNGWEFAMKTGTTNDAKDGWMMGFSTKYAAGVWVGHHTGQREMSGFMETMTRPIWSGWMHGAHADKEPIERERPGGVQSLPAYVVRSNPGLGAVTPSSDTDLYPSWYEQPSRDGGNHDIDVVSNKLATSCTPDRARQRVSNANANIFSVDPFVDGGRGGNTSETDDVHRCSDTKPRITVTANECRVVATVTQGTHPISSDRFPGQVQFSGGGRTQTINVGSSPATVRFNAPAGTDRVTATVIDSVLYDSRAAVNTSNCRSGGGGNSGSSINLSNPSPDGNSVTFNWSGGSGPYRVIISGEESTDCGPTNGKSCTKSGLAPGSYSAFVRDDDDKQSNNVLFTIGGP